MIEYIIGIDPGLDGAIAVLEFIDSKFTKRIEIIDMPTYVVKKGSTKRKYSVEEIVVFLKQFIHSGVHSHVYLESVHSMPSQGVVAMFSMGEGFGILQGVIKTLKATSFTLVTPQSWKKKTIGKIDKKLSQADKKKMSVLVAEKTYPNVELRTKRNKILDGRGDALLIAEYGRILQYERDK